MADGAAGARIHDLHAPVRQCRGERGAGRVERQVPHRRAGRIGQRGVHLPDAHRAVARRDQGAAVLQEFEARDVVRVAGEDEARFGGLDVPDRHSAVAVARGQELAVGAEGEVGRARGAEPPPVPAHVGCDEDAGQGGEREARSRARAGDGDRERGHEAVQHEARAGFQ